MSQNKRYWSGLDELHGTEEFKATQGKEFPGVQAVDEFLSDDRLESTHTGRRDFLKFMGFSLTAATLAACETPVIKSIPYTNKPEEVTPGVANYYASTFYNGQDYGQVLVKTREGRPIFVKSNATNGEGKVGVRVNASVMGLYDSARLAGPTKGGQPTDWSTIDADVKSALAAGGRNVLLTHTIASPSLRRAVNSFCESTGAEHIQFDAISYQGIRKANQSDYGVDAVPCYHMDKAQAIVTIGADFLGTWGDTSVQAAAWAKGRKPEAGSMSALHAFESVMTLTGSNADRRNMIKPSEAGRVALAILHGLTQGGAVDLTDSAAAGVGPAVAALKAAGSNGLVVSGSNDVNVQLVVNACNRALGAYGTTVNLEQPWLLGRGDDAAVSALVKDMNEGSVNAVIVHGVNPAYVMGAFGEALSNVKTSVSTSLFADETASRCTHVAPDHHWLESWGDVQRTAARVDWQQPTISPLFNSRAAGSSLLAWSGAVESDWYTYLRQTWNANYTADQLFTDSAWNSALHDGFMPLTAGSETTQVNMVAAGSALGQAIQAVNGLTGGAFELSLYQKNTIGNGDQTANPMLQETPDPLTKITWDNYVTMSKVDMENMGLNTYIGQEKPASVVRVSVGNMAVELPALLLPGQKPGTVGIALGYGRGANGEAVGKAAFQMTESGDFERDASSALVPVGKNAFVLAGYADGLPLYEQYNVSVEATGASYPLASTQIHSTDMGRDSIVKETTFSAYFSERNAAKGSASWNKLIQIGVHEDVNADGVINAQDSKPTEAFDLWHEHAVEEVGHRWGMTIDLTTCTGCSACVTACHIENNVPVVGKDEVRRHRDMHWMRIDRFFASDYSLERGEEEGVGAIGSYRRMEDPSENPQTVHMPMMCQHCNHAPCETVCPVAATTHSNEGLNQMTYNRCIGTRYCANNCPYKVRRFNWFNYPGYKKFANFNPSQDNLTRMVLNPDVTVRSRGVMEKCSMCVQRIQEGKLNAKKEGTKVPDGAVVTACAEACPTDAIQFGDLNDKQSQIHATSENNRAYHALEEIGVKPNIFYMTKVRNTESTEA